MSITEQINAAKAATTVREFQLPSTNCTVVTKDGRRITAPSGVIVADTPELMALCEDLVACGGAVPYVHSKKAVI